MKRTITSILGALAVAAGFSMFAAPANAACNPYPAPPIADTPAVSINNWPRTKEKLSSPAHSSLYYCAAGTAATDTQFATVWGAAQTIANKGSNVPPPYDVAEMFYNDKLRIYFFEDINALDAEWGTDFHTRIANGEPSAVTLKAGDVHNASIPVNSIGIFRKRLNGTTYAANTLKGNVYHELGHAFDRIIGNPSATASSRWYKTQVGGGIFRNDVAALNLQSRANAFGTTSAATIAICQADYNNAAKTNWEVAQCIWPYQLDRSTAPGADALLHQLNSQETYANIFAVIVGGLLWDVNDSQVMYDLGAFLGDNFISGDSNNYFKKSTSPLGVIYGGTP